MEALAQRVGKLERRIRILGGTLAAVLVGAVALVSMGQAASDSEVLRGKGLVIEDSRGVSRIVAGVTPEDVVTLGLFDKRKDGPPRLSLMISRDGVPSVRLWSERGKCQATVSLLNGGAAFSVADKKERPRVSLAFTPAEGAQVLFQNEAGEPVYAVPMKPIITRSLAPGRPGAANALDATK